MVVVGRGWMLMNWCNGEDAAMHIVCLMVLKRLIFMASSSGRAVSSSSPANTETAVAKQPIRVQHTRCVSHSLTHSLLLSVSHTHTQKHTLPTAFNCSRCSTTDKPLGVSIT